MNLRRRGLTIGIAAALAFPRGVLAADRVDAAGVLHDWYRLILELVRHTPTLSPPVASRSFAYIGITAWEALAAPGRRSMAGQVHGLLPLPPRPAGLHDAAVMQGAMTRVVTAFFASTGPTGQRAMAAMARTLDARTADGVAPDVAAASVAHGQAVADHVLAWSEADGGAVIGNMGFPMGWPAPDQPQDWVPTSLVRMQQAPLLPGWGGNRTFAMPDGAACGLPPPPDYSEEPGSAFHAEAVEVYEAVRNLTREQRLIARFWSDDPMLSPTPPGHWIAIAMQCLEAEGAAVARRAEVLALVGIAVADAFIACWHAKFEYDLLRPVTYIRRVIDKTWEPILITPPFPEYPSGHSTQSGAAAEVLTHLFGEGFAFTDTTHVDEGLPPRDFPDFRAAAREAGMSRLYGGIHFRAAIERGLGQGVCVAGHALRLRFAA